MRYSFSQFTQLLRVVLVALPVLLLLGLNGRTVSLLRPTPPAGAPATAAPRATVVKQKVRLEAAAPAGSWVVPTFALGWLPPTPFGSWQPRLRRRAALRAALGAPVVFVAQAGRLRQLRAAVQAQAP